MSDTSEIGTIRMLPDGGERSARITSQASDRLTVDPIDVHPVDEQSCRFPAGTLVEIQTPVSIFLGEVVGSGPNSQITVAVEHFVERASLAEIAQGWKAVEGACR